MQLLLTFRQTKSINIFPVSDMVCLCLLEAIKIMHFEILSDCMYR